MTSLTVQDGSLVIRDGKLGLDQGCCCGPVCDCKSPGYEPALASESERGMVWLTFSACIGSGAAATVDAPNAASPCDYAGLAGPISGVTLTNPGSGYALLGRAEPTVTATVAGGSGATLSVSLQQGSVSPGADCGNATVSVWSVESVSVTAGGSGYAEGANVTFATTNGTQVFAATGVACVVHDEPQNATLNINSAGGSGAALQPVWELLPSNQWPAPHKKTYRLASVTVINGGSGYADYEPIYIAFPTVADGEVQEAAIIDADIVGTGGVIQQVYVASEGDPSTPSPAGRYVGSQTSSVEAVAITNGNGGQYYREDASLTPYVATVTVTINQQGVSGGYGGIITAEVEESTASVNFGKIKSLSIVSGGSGYLDAPLACSVPDKIYVTMNGKTAELPIKPMVYFDPSFGYIPPELRAGFHTGPVGIGFPFEMWGVCTSGVNALGTIYGSADDAEAALGQYVWESFAVMDGQVFHPLHYGFLQGVDPLLLACQCDQRLHLLLGTLTSCNQYIPQAANGYYGLGWRRRKVRRRIYCLRFEKDENGCPVGDATIVNSWFTDTELPDFPCDAVPDWRGNMVSDCRACTSDCLNAITPHASFMPP